MSWKPAAHLVGIVGVMQAAFVRKGAYSQRMEGIVFFIAVNCLNFNAFQRGRCGSIYKFDELSVSMKQSMGTICFAAL